MASLAVFLQSFKGLRAERPNVEASEFQSSFGLYSAKVIRGLSRNIAGDYTQASRSCFGYVVQAPSC